jgi:geranylgeranyl reductase family protein
VKYDVVIVGAGPAGSASAAALAQRGYDVALVDRQDFPRDKTCGDGIPPGSIELLNALGMREKILAADFYPVTSIRLGSPWGRTWETTFAPRRPGMEFVIAPRVKLDALIQQHAIECGASFIRGDVRSLIKDGTRARGVVAQTADGDCEIEARLVIGADGATSVVARELGRERSSAGHRGIAIRAYVEGIHTLPHKVEFYFYRHYLPGYGWIFPLGEGRANIGVIARADRFKKRGRSLKDLLDDFMHQPALAGRLDADVQVSDAASWQLPYASTRIAPCAFDGALLVGDAGRFVDALTGEGIHNALISAAVATDVADAALKRDDVSAPALAPYQQLCQRRLGPLVSRAYGIQKWADRFPVGLEAMFIGARMVNRPLNIWLNHVSTDFVIGH